MRLIQRGSAPAVVVWKQVLLRTSRHHQHPRHHSVVAALFSTSTTIPKEKDKPSPPSSSSSSLVLTQMHYPIKGVATITMNNMPVNSLSLEMLTSLSHAIKQVENYKDSDNNNNNIQSLILTSCKSGIFSAGLDIMELYQPNLHRLQQFWYAFQQLYIDLYGSRLACIAAISGNAPAAGCMLALSCDYRIMMTTTATATDNIDSSSGNDNKKKPVSNFTIGLNETKLGIAAPSWLARQFHDTIGRRQAELGLSLGLLYTPEQALKIGLVDELVAMPSNDADDIMMKRAEQVALEWIRIPSQARFASKMLMRQDAIDHLITNRQADTDHFVNFVTNQKVQENLTLYLEMLAAKKNKKKT